MNGAAVEDARVDDEYVQWESTQRDNANRSMAKYREKNIDKARKASNEANKKRYYSDPGMRIAKTEFERERRLIPEVRAAHNSQNRAYKARKRLRGDA